MSLQSVTTITISPDRKFHPQFDDPEAGIIIASKEGTLFRIHSAILKSASGLLSLFLSGSNPKRSEPAICSKEGAAPGNQSDVDDTTADVITIPFLDNPLERVLLMISAKPIPPWQSFAELEAAIDVMDYLDTPGPISYIRHWCLTPIFLSEPIRLYGLGARYGWDDVMQHASKLSLSLNLFPSPPFPGTPQSSQSQNVEVQLSRLPGDALYRLLRLHRRRRDEFRIFILDTTNFPGGAAEKWQCNCGRSNDNTHWRLLCSRLIWTMDQDVSGEKILLEMESWPESTQFWNTSCSRCPLLQAGKLDTLTKLRNCFGRLPTTI